jgi:small subunit ribosomal protein S7
MEKGNKSKIEKIINKTLLILKDKVKTENPIEIVKKAIKNIEPTIELKSIKIAGITHQVPFEIKTTRQESLAIRWLVSSAKNRSEKTIVLRLSQEILSAYKNKGASFKKKDDIHKKAELNRTLIHYRW